MYSSSWIIRSPLRANIDSGPASAVSSFLCSWRFRMTTTNRLKIQPAMYARLRSNSHDMSCCAVIVNHHSGPHGEAGKCHRQQCNAVDNLAGYDETFKRHRFDIHLWGPLRRPLP